MHDSIDTDFEESASFFEWGHKEFRVDHPLFMNDLKLLAKNKDQTDSLVPTVHCFSKDIRTEFQVSMCGVLVLKRGKFAKLSGQMILPNGQMMRN